VTAGGAFVCLGAGLHATVIAGDDRGMSFDRASAFYMGACQILRSDDVKPGERAIAYACLAQAEVLLSLAEMAGHALPDAEAGSDADHLGEAEDAFDRRSFALIEKINEQFHDGAP
jgi:hypothetical protein